MLSFMMRMMPTYLAALLVVLVPLARESCRVEAAVLCDTRRQEGSVIESPPQVSSLSATSTDLVVSLVWSADFLSNETRYCYRMLDGEINPTIRIRRGMTLTLALYNSVGLLDPTTPLSAYRPGTCGSRASSLYSTNLHFHGLHASPQCNHDEVIHTDIEPGEYVNYSIAILPDHPPGLYWYHPHMGGLVEEQVNGGGLGAIIIEGIESVFPSTLFQPVTSSTSEGASPYIWEQQLVVRSFDAELVADTDGSSAPPKWDISVNHVPVLFPDYIPPTLLMPRQQDAPLVLFRFLGGMAGVTMNVSVVADGVMQPLVLLARDGFPLKSPVTSQWLVVTAAQRVEFLMATLPDDTSNATLVTHAFDTGPVGDSDPFRPLARLLFSEVVPMPTMLRLSIPVSSASASTTSVIANSNNNVSHITAVLFPPNLTVANHRLFFFSQDSNGFYITESGKEVQYFQAQGPPAVSVTSGTVEEWTIENRARETHVFHIHLTHFVVIALNGVTVPNGDVSRRLLLDTVEVPFWSGLGAYPSVTFRISFVRVPPGVSVYHCHILEHEDKGMMQRFEVLPAPTAAQPQGTTGSNSTSSPPLNPPSTTLPLNLSRQDAGGSDEDENRRLGIGVGIGVGATLFVFLVVALACACRRSCNRNTATEDSHNKGTNPHAVNRSSCTEEEPPVWVPRVFGVEDGVGRIDLLPKRQHRQPSQPSVFATSPPSVGGHSDAHPSSFLLQIPSTPAATLSGSDAVVDDLLKRRSSTDARL